MGLVIRQSIKSTIISYIGAVIGIVTVLYIYPYFLKPETIGLLRILIELSFILLFFSQLGMTNSMMKFYPYFRTPDGLDNGFIRWVLLLPFLGFLFCALLFVVCQKWIIDLFSDKSALLSDYYYYILPLTLALMYINISEIYASLRYRIANVKLIKEIFIRVSTIGVILLYFFYFPDSEILIGFFVFVYIVAMIISFLSFSYKGLNTETAVMDKKMRTDILKFSVYVIMSGAGGALISKMDLFIIGAKIDYYYAGIFSLSYFIGSFIEMPSRSIVQVISPFTSEAIKQENWDEVEQHYKKGSLHQFIVGAIVFLLVWCNIDSIFMIMPNGEVFKEGKYIVLFIGIAKMVDAATSLNVFILGNSKYYYYTLFLTIFLGVITVIANYILIPMYGINGAGIASCITVILYNLVALWVVHAKLKIHPISYKLLWVCILGLACVSISYFLPFIGNPYIDIIVRSTIIIAVYFFIVIRFNFSCEINILYRRGIDLLLGIKRKK